MISFFIDFLWMDNKIAGNKIMFVNIDINKVKDTNTPNATVPPKLGAEKIEKPLNKIIDVYTILKPVSLIAAEIAKGAELYFFNSWRYLVKK